MSLLEDLVCGISSDLRWA